MTIKVGINGMGRIGRMIVRSIYENYKGKIRLVLTDEKSKIPEVITLIYKNSLTFYLPYISITIGLILFIIIILSYFHYYFDVIMFLCYISHLFVIFVLNSD